ncbi:MAG: pirin family protein [Verrucomicrobia bacterium]|nr:MAG: pirin family protein [Verrucomicrobiota bacterium]
MKMTVRKSSARGHADHGWLKSQHTFSFADYYDPKHMGFRSLRVINEDHVAAGGGFSTHPHRDMEIFSYLVAGTLEHKDSMGNGRQLKPGQIQLMSAGSGVTHSEFNPSREEQVHLLQIWIMPHTQGLKPSYTEWHPQPETENDTKVLVISPDGRDHSAIIHQDAEVYRVRLKAGSSISHNLHAGRGLWLQLISGKASAAGFSLEAGDAISSEFSGSLSIVANEDCEALLFDLA